MRTLEEINARLQHINVLVPEVRRVADAKREEYDALVAEKIQLLHQRNADARLQEIFGVDGEAHKAMLTTRDEYIALVLERRELLDEQRDALRMVNA